MQTFIQGLIDFFVTTINAIFSIFPNSPFDFITSGLSGYADYIAQINYFLPIYEMIAIGQAWLLCVVIWYGYVIVLRWIKAVE